MNSLKNIMNSLKFFKGLEQNKIGENILGLNSLNDFYISDGYLKCDGSIVSQNSYPNLYSKIGLIRDNFSWATQTSGTTSTINGITYGNGYYVYGGGGGILGTSTNVINWATQTSGTTNNITALNYGNGVYIYGGTTGVLGISGNAITWTSQTSGSTGYIRGLIYGNGLYVYGDSSGNISINIPYSYNPATSFKLPVYNNNQNNYIRGD